MRKDGHFSGSNMHASRIMEKWKRCRLFKAVVLNMEIRTKRAIIGGFITVFRFNGC